MTRGGNAGSSRASTLIVMVLALGVATGGLGAAGVSLVRFLFIFGAAGIGWWAWRAGPERHLQAAIALFVFAPFLRRVVDMGCGFDASAIMLAGPLVAIAIPAIDVFEAMLRGAPAGTFGPYLLSGACLAYAALVSAFGGELSESGILTLKWGAPILYGYWISLRAREAHALIPAALGAFAWVAPVIALYGIYQYFDPQEWDRIWMVRSRMDSIGLPHPYQVRVFSTLNSPASFATFSAFALLLLGFCLRPLWAVLLSLPVAVALALSLYRTAWLSLACSILFCTLFAATRARALLIATCLAAAALVAIAAGPSGDVLTERFETFTEGADRDGSLSARIDEFYRFYSQAERYVVGVGLADVDTKDNGIGILDGTAVEALVGMGVIVGPLFLAGLAWAALRSVLAVEPGAGPVAVVAAAIAVFEVVQMPFGSVTSGELGFLFWVAVGFQAGAPRWAWTPMPMAARRRGNLP